MSLIVDVTSVYRVRSNGELLYVGVTGNLPARIRHHARHRAWWSDVDLVEVEHYPDRASARAAERAAIFAEHPRYNILGRDRSRDYPELVAELTDAAATYRQCIDERNDAIRDAVAAGWSLRKIAPVVGLSHEQVRQIAHRTPPAEPGGCRRCPHPRDDDGG